MSISNKKQISNTLIRKMLCCIKEYEAIKSKTSIQFKTVKAFCEHHKFSHQNFMKIYHRYKATLDESMLLPQKRGPRYKSRRIDLSLEERILDLRKLRLNRSEILLILRKDGIKVSATTIYNVFKRHKLNRLSKSTNEKIIKPKRILMSYSGELLHVDLHQLSKGITIQNSNHTYYLLGLVDGYSRLAWVELLDSKKALDVMFGFLKSFNLLRMEYGIEAESVLTDNGSEFGSGAKTKDKDHHPFERLLLELDIKHKYTKPYNPQQNGKVERFWKTLKEDFIEGSLYEDATDLKEELLGFIVYYNEHRPHSALGGLTPKEFNKKNNKNVTN